MIRIHKPSSIPEKLSIQGKEQTRKDKISYSRNPNLYQSGEKNFDFKNNIYAHSTVKDALIQAQHGKCCFCEALVFQEGDVEHFRPKKAVKQNKGEPLNYPAYYWLAYDWNNLYLACKPCNQNYKKNLFPLENPENRAKHHKADLNIEQPILIDPAKEEPTEFIGFRGASAYGIDPNERGTKSIEILGLNRQQLRAARREKILDLQSLQKIIILSQSPQYANDEAFQNLAKEAQKELENLYLSSNSFSSALYYAVTSNFEFVD